MEFIETIPADVMEQICNRKVIEAGFGAGPSCVVGKVQHYPEPVALAEGIAWIEKYRNTLKAAHLLLDDLTVLWFRRDGFNRYDQTVHDKPPRPCVEIEVDRG